MPSLKELRSATGRSRAKVAADLKMSERHLYRLENGLSPLRKITAYRIANYYGVKVDDIEEARAA